MVQFTLLLKATAFTLIYLTLKSNLTRGLDHADISCLGVALNSAAVALKLRVKLLPINKMSTLRF